MGKQNFEMTGVATIGLNKEVNVSQIDLIYRDLFLKCAAEYAPWRALSDEDKNKYVRRIIRSIKNATIEYCGENSISANIDNAKFVEELSARMSMHLANFDPNSSVGSTYYIDGIIDGSIDPKCIGGYTSYQLAPDASREYREGIEIRKNQKIEIKFAIRPCKFCGEFKVTREATAGRSLGSDEITGFKLTCINCGKKWYE